MVETVYNFRVANCHTYFVGCAEWGFSVWAHNAEYGVRRRKQCDGETERCHPEHVRGHCESSKKGSGVRTGDQGLGLAEEAEQFRVLRPPGVAHRVPQSAEGISRVRLPEAVLGHRQRG